MSHNMTPREHTSYFELTPTGPAITFFSEVFPILIEKNDSKSSVEHNINRSLLALDVTQIIFKDRISPKELRDIFIFDLWRNGATHESLSRSFGLSVDVINENVIGQIDSLFDFTKVE